MSFRDLMVTGPDGRVASNRHSTWEPESKGLPASRVLLASPITHAVLADFGPTEVLREIEHLHSKGEWIDGIPAWAQEVNDRTFGPPEDKPFGRVFEMLYVEKQAYLWLIDVAYGDH